jgi:peptidoglycan/LPS O-acetylase OafA/YrhL
MPQQPVILGRKAPRPARRSRWSVASLADVAPMLLFAGCLLAIVGWVDVALLYWPQQFGDPQWEFGIIATTYDTLAMALMGMLLVGVGLRARGSPPLLVKAFGVACVLVALFCLALLVIFTLDIPLAVNAMHGNLPGAQGAAARPSPVVIAGIKRGIAKAVLYGLGYGTTFTAMGIMLWRGAGLTEPARSDDGEG